MDDDRIAELAYVLIACHGTSAEQIARLRLRRCERRGEPEWAETWRKVVELIAVRTDRPIPTPHLQA